MQKHPKGALKLATYDMYVAGLQDTEGDIYMRSRLVRVPK